jgi:hypothetical protein
MATKNDLRIALLIDGDNAQPSLMPLILEALEPVLADSVIRK